MPTYHYLLFFNMGGGEIFVILLVILLFFGSKKIPELARGMGKGIRYFKEATGEVQKEISNTSKEIEEDINIASQSKKRDNK